MHSSEHFDQVADLVDHSAHCRRVLQFADTIEFAQSKSDHGSAVGCLGADRAPNELDLDGLWRCHVRLQLQANRSSTDLPRLAATAAGVVELASASKVARTML